MELTIIRKKTDNCMYVSYIKEIPELKALGRTQARADDRLAEKVIEVMKGERTIHRVKHED